MIDFARVTDAASEQIERVMLLGGDGREAVGATLASKGVESADIAHIIDWLDRVAVEHVPLLRLDPERVVRLMTYATFVTGFFLREEVE